MCKREPRYGRLVWTLAKIRLMLQTEQIAFCTYRFRSESEYAVCVCVCVHSYENMQIRMNTILSFYFLFL